MKFNFTSQISTTEEQSERLLALGVKKETADMMYCKTSYGTFVTSKDDDYLEHLDFSAWSLHRLIEMLPDSLFDWYGLDFSKRGIFYADFRNGSYSVFEAFAKSDKTLYDNIIDCIEWLIKEGRFNKEYLEE